MVTNSTHHTLAVCFSPTASHGKILSDCVSHSATAKLGRATLTIGNVNCRCRVEKSLFAVVATENSAKCDLFVERMRATKVNMHPCASASIEQWLNVSLVQITVDFGCKNFGMHLFHHVPRPLLCLLDSACRSWSLPRNSRLSWMNDFVQRATFITSSKEKTRLSMINEWQIHQQVMNVQSCEVHLN